MKYCPECEAEFESTSSMCKNCQCQLVSRPDRFSVSCRPYGNNAILGNNSLEIKYKEIAIPYKNITNIKFFGGIPLLLCPVITIEYIDETGKNKKHRIGFHNTLFRLITGYSKPGQFYQKLMDMVQKQS